MERDDGSRVFTAVPELQIQPLGKWQNKGQI